MVDSVRMDFNTFGIRNWEGKYGKEGGLKEGYEGG